MSTPEHLAAVAAVDRAPVRADLVDVQPLYYPVVEQRRFGSVRAMCQRMNWPRSLVDEYVVRARLERSEHVVIDRLRLGEPDAEMAAVLVFQPGGAVILCAGLFGEMTEHVEEAGTVAVEFGELPEFKDKLIFVGEFRPNKQRPAH